MDEMQALHEKNQVGARQKILPQLRKAFRPTHLIALAIGVAIGNWLTLDAAIRLAATHYEQGIQHGHKKALSLNPVSADLEYTCAGLWLGSQK